MSTTIILADDHAIMRDGLRAIIGSHPDLKIVAQAASGRQAVALAAQFAPDIVVMDIGLPDLNGVEATRRILRADPKVRVIALSTYTDLHFVRAMLSAGARAYVVKASASECLLMAITAVMNGKVYLCPQIEASRQSAPGELSGSCETASQAVLTSREVEVLQLVAEGHSSRDISEKLGIAEDTVEVHRRNIMRKLDLHNVADLTRHAIRNGLTTA